MRDKLLTLNKKISKNILEMRELIKIFITNHLIIIR